MLISMTCDGIAVGQIGKGAYSESALRVLLAEAFEVRVHGWDGARERGLDVDHAGGVAVPASRLRGRLDAARRLLSGRHRLTYIRGIAEDAGLTPAELQAFVRLAGEMEERGHQPRFQLVLR